MADPSPDAALQGLPPGTGLLSDGLYRSKRRSDNNYRAAERMRNRPWRKQWTPGNYGLHKIRNTQKAARRSSEGAFKRLVNDRAKNMGLDNRFDPTMYAALHEEFKFFGAEYFRLLKDHINRDGRVTVPLEERETLRWIMRAMVASHPLAKYNPKYM